MLCTNPDATQFRVLRDRPDDIASLAVFLSGSGSSYITGAVIPLDGGVSAAG